MTLQKMTAAYYDQVFKGHCIGEMVRQFSSHGLWSEASAEDRARLDLEDTLPEGVETPGNYLFEIADAGLNLGAVWFGNLEAGDPTVGFIYEIHIFREFQGMGYGTAALGLLGDTARTLGFGEIRLHVFTDNPGAVKAYTKAGFTEYQRRDQSLWMKWNLFMV